MSKKALIFLFPVLAAGLVLIGAGNASAENSLRKDAKGLSFSVANSDILVSGRMLVQNDLAVLVGFGFNRADNDETKLDYKISAGLRKYLGTSDLAPYVGGNIFYTHDDEVIGGGPGASLVTERTLGLDGHFGAEYFFTKMMSAEAQVGLDITDKTNAGNVKGADETAIGTFSTAVGINIYF